MSIHFETLYGEFTLMQWIKMILNKEIILPPYQRHFIWEKKDVKKLHDSLEKNYIIPPILLASHNKEIYILDGQQRLTSLILLYFSIFPNREKLKVEYNNDENDIDVEDLSILKWTFNFIQNDFCNYNSIEFLKNKYTNDPNYEPLNVKTTKNFFNDNFIGFSFTRYLTTNSRESESHFAHTFNRINTSGYKLLERESRRAYYWLCPDIINILEPESIKNIKLYQKVKGGTDIDLVRALAFSYNYFYLLENNIPESKLAKGYGNKLDKYFTGFVLRAAGFDEDDKFKFFGNLTNILHDSEKKLKSLSEIVSLEDFLPTLTAIYIYDYFFFGLVYWIFVNDRGIKIDRIQELKTKLERACKEFVDNTKQEDYNTLGRIQHRLSESISIYKSYTIA